MFTDGFVYGIIVPVIPFILQDQSLVPEPQIQLSTSYIITAFAISDLIGAPLVAWYVDRTVRRRVPFLAGLAMMIAGTILFGLANKVWIFFLGRVLQGFSSAVLYTVGLAMLVDTVKGEETGQWMGTAMSCNNIGIIASPILGGILYKAAGRHAVFWVMIGFVAVDFILRSLMIEKPPSARLGKNIQGCEQQHELSNIGDIVSESENKHWVDGSITVFDADGLKEEPTVKIKPEVEDCPAVKAHTGRQRSRRLSGVIRLLRSPRLLAALYGCFLNEFIVACLCTIIPLYVKQTFNWNSLDAGLIFLTIAVPGFAGPAAGCLSDRVGPRWVAIAGFALTGPPLILLRLVDHNSKEQMILLCGLLVLTGCAIVFFLSPLGADLSIVTDEIASTQYPSAENNDAHVSLYASSFSMMNSALAAATLLGPLFAGALNHSYGWRTVTAAVGTLCFSGLVPCFFFTGGGAVGRSGEREG